MTALTCCIDNRPLSLSLLILSLSHSILPLPNSIRYQNDRTDLLHRQPATVTVALNTATAELNTATAVLYPVPK
jgi:hypothetical protein